MKKYYYLLLAGMALLGTTCTPLDINPKTVLIVGTLTDDAGPNAASIRGEIIQLKSNSVAQYGHVFSDSIAQPTLADASTNLGSRNDLGSFTSNLSELAEGTSYTVRAYAIVGSDTTYSNSILNFTTATRADLITSESITTQAPFNIRPTSCQAQARLTGPGLTTVTAYGLCIGTTTTPSLELNTACVNINSGINNDLSFQYSGDLIGLAPDTFYYIRAYVTNSAGTFYGNSVSFRTGQN